MRASAGRVCVHSSSWAPEWNQCQLLSCDRELRISNVAGPQNLPEKPLAEVLADVKWGSGERVVRIVHEQCNKHSMLAGQLRPQGTLAEILDEAVVFVSANCKED